MKFKLKADHFTSRIPLVVRRRNNVVYFQTQIDVARADGYRRKTYIEKYKTDDNIKEVGMLAGKLLKRFEELGDLSIAEFEELVGMNIEEYESIPKGETYLKFYDAKDYKDLDRNYDHCNFDYNIAEKKYSFTLWWSYKDGSRYYLDNSDSLGEPKVLTFDEPLEFTEFPEPEKLGEMIFEAFDRSRKIADKVAGNPYPEKDIELLSGSKLTVSAPRDKHFSDYDDYGVGEIYQAYMYLPREDAEWSAAFSLGIAAELDCDISEENVRRAWEKLYGKAEFFEVKNVEHGIFKLRAEMRNKSVHRISYILEIADCELLDCTMELRKPNSRKKLDEKLTGLFEEFARGCRFKN
ncbi:MAG: hypothetical protein NC085_01285 [Muribaculaceae bacterium]|nr:hypothetical protein [Muribaculaceae bacterium]